MKVSCRPMLPKAARVVAYKLKVAYFLIGCVRPAVYIPELSFDRVE